MTIGLNVFGPNKVIGSQKKLISRYCDTVGDGTGTKNAIGDYSGVATPFMIKPATNKIFRISRLIVHIQDAGSVDAGSYGNGIVLTNGIQVRVQDDSGTINDLTDGVTIITNADWGRMCYDVNESTFGAGNNYVNARWTFWKSGQFIRLIGSAGERLEVVLNDNFTGLKGHYFLVQGYEE